MRDVIGELAGCSNISAAPLPLTRTACLHAQEAAPHLSINNTSAPAPPHAMSHTRGACAGRVHRGRGADRVRRQRDLLGARGVGPSDSARRRHLLQEDAAGRILLHGGADPHPAVPHLQYMDGRPGPPAAGTVLMLRFTVSKSKSSHTAERLTRRGPHRARAPLLAGSRVVCNFAVGD